MDKAGKRKSRAKSKSKAKRTEPKVEHLLPAAAGHLLPAVQNQLAYINNLSLMNRVQPRMFLASNIQDRIDYKTQESIEDGDIRERIKMLYEAQALQNQQMMQLGQGLVMNQNDMRAMMQNNSIAPSVEGADPVQNHLQDPFSAPQPQPEASPVGSDTEEIDAGIAPGNITEAFTQGEHTSKLVDLYTQNGYRTTTATNN